MPLYCHAPRGGQLQRPGSEHGPGNRRLRRQSAPLHLTHHMLIIGGIGLITILGVQTTVLHIRFQNEWEGNFRAGGLGSMQQFLRSKGRKLTMTSLASLSQPDNSLSAILRRHPSRIPGYTPHSNATLFGYVLRDFASRVLSRHIFSKAGSGADVLVVSKDTFEMAVDGTTSASFHSVGPGFVRHARKQGHTVHSFSRLEDASWDIDNGDSGKMPGWILLAVFDPPHGMEDNALTSDVATSLLSKCTVTYIVFRISASQNGSYGTKAADELIQRGYKVQVLSTSHSVRGHPANTLLDTNTSVAKLLRIGWALSVEGKGNEDVNGNMFHAYLFATQGLDLAIPSQREYLDVKGGGHISFNATTNEALVPMKRCKPSPIRIAFMHASSDTPTLGHFHITCNGRQITEAEVKRLWMSAEAVERSEAACVSVSSLLCGEGSACTSRILPSVESPIYPQRSSDDPNLLLLMIDPISQPLFKQLLPKTRSLLEDMGFVSFDQYTVVGDNSGPNQAALYSGTGLVGRTDISSQHRDHFQWIWDDLRQNRGYATYKAEDGCIRNSNMVASIQPNTTHGSVLHEMNCFDFQRPNCIGHEPAAEHLIRHVSQFINVYSKRERKWAAFASFVDSHEDTMSLALSLDDQFHKFLSGLSGSILDDTMILLVSDHGLHYGPFLQSRQGARERARPVLQMMLPRRFREDQKTMDILRSNAVLWTSPFDVYSTLRHVLLNDVDGTNSQSSSSLLLPLGPERKSCSRTKAIPKRYCDLFENFTQKNSSSLDNLVEMDSPPSMLSFFADIPRAQKYQKQQCGARNPPDLSEKSIPSKCLCATSHRSWHSCNGHYPWKDRSSSFSHEFATLVDCPGHDLHFDLRLVKDEKIVKRLNETKTDIMETTITERRPNILFIEIDSVSIAHANRHFHRTRELLRRHRIQKNPDQTFSCASGICAADFTRFSLTGPNSITNQVSAWSGCITTPVTEMCETDSSGICDDSAKTEFGLRHYKTFGLASVWCHPEASMSSPGKSPLIFDVARRNGYVTLFGEEFCFEDSGMYSPYVTQGNLFKVDADIMVHRAHCALATRYARRHNITYGPGSLWTVDSYLEPCVDGAIGLPMPRVPLEILRQMWIEYRDEPKFAFLNAMAAHDYSLAFGSMYLNAEAYDDMIHDFLKEIIESPEGSNTVIIIRSDHGNQGWANPSSVEYSNQIEHRRPWIEAIIPENLQSMSLEALYTNQQRLVNSVDLYTTLRHIISGDAGQLAELKPPVPEWSRNILRTVIVPERSCREARSSPEHCRLENEVTSTAPTYGICNPYDEGLIFCEKDGCRVHGRRVIDDDQDGDHGDKKGSPGAAFPKVPSIQGRAKLLSDFTKSIVDAAAKIHGDEQ